MDLAVPIPLIIPCPCMHPMTDGGMRRMTAMIALPCVSMQPRAVSRHVGGDELVAGPRVRMVAHPQALLSRVARHHTDDGGAIVGIGAVPLALMGASAWRVGGIAMRRACFPRRSDTAHPPRRLCRTSLLGEPSRAGSPGGAAAGYAAVCGTGPTRGPAARSTLPWPFRATRGPAWPVVAGFSRRPSLSARYNSRCRSDTGRPENTAVRGTVAAWHSHSGGISGPRVQVTLQPSRANAVV
jgi:hypothetical protein